MHLMNVGFLSSGKKSKTLLECSYQTPHLNTKIAFLVHYKIIVLDEADSMTQDAQSALRRTMETYSKITRFCLICNYVTRIIDPLASRCSKFRFKMLDEDNARKRLEDIAEKENLRLETGAADTLIKCSEGDLRKAITFLQSAAKLTGSGVTAPVRMNGHALRKGRLEDDSDEDRMDNDEASPAVVSAANVEDIAGVIPDSIIQALVQAMQPRSKVNSYNAIEQSVSDLVAEGWSAMQVVSQVSMRNSNVITLCSLNMFQLYQTIVFDDTIANQQKRRITLQFSDIDKRLADGADEHLAMLDLSLQISKILSDL